MHKKKISLIIATALMVTSSNMAWATTKIKAPVKGNVGVVNKTIKPSRKIEIPLGAKEIPAQVGINLLDAWNLKLPDFIKGKDISGIVINNETSYIPVDVNIVSNEEVNISPLNAYIGNSKYILRIFLNDGKQYFMNFTTLAAPRRADIEPNNNYLKGNLIKAGETILGTTNSKDSSDWYKVVLSQDGMLNLDLVNKKDKNITIYVYGKTGNSSNNIMDDWAPSKSVRHDEIGLAAGTYYIKINSQDADYELKTGFKKAQCDNDKENNNNYINAKELKLNENNYGHIAYNYDNVSVDNNDWYKVTINKDGVLNLKLKHNYDKNIKLYLYGKDGQASGKLIDNWAPEKSVRENSIGLSAGTYYLCVNSDSFGEYELSSEFIEDKNNKDVEEENDKYIYAKDIKSNDEVIGHIGYLYDNCGQDNDDWYKLIIDKDGTLNINLEHLKDKRINLYLYGKDGTNSQKLIDDWAPEKSIRTDSVSLSAGTYYISVNSEDSGAYKLKTSFK